MSRRRPAGQMRMNGAHGEFTAQRASQSVSWMRRKRLQPQMRVPAANENPHRGRRANRCQCGDTPPPWRPTCAGASGIRPRPPHGSHTPRGYSTSSTSSMARMDCFGHDSAAVEPSRRCVGSPATRASAVHRRVLTHRSAGLGVSPADRRAATADSGSKLRSGGDQSSAMVSTVGSGHRTSSQGSRDNRDIGLTARRSRKSAHLTVKAAITRICQAARSASNAHERSWCR